LRVPSKWSLLTHRSTGRLTMACGIPTGVSLDPCVFAFTISFGSHLGSRSAPCRNRHKGESGTGAACGYYQGRSSGRQVPRKHTHPTRDDAPCPGSVTSRPSIAWTATISRAAKATASTPCSPPATTSDSSCAGSQSFCVPSSPVSVRGRVTTLNRYAAAHCDRLRVGIGGHVRRAYRNGVRYTSACVIAAAILSVGALAFAEDPIRPDAKLTPGAVMSMDVSAICFPGYSKTVRHTSGEVCDPRGVHGDHREPNRLGRLTREPGMEPTNW